MKNELVLYEKKGALVTLTLNRLKARNALNEQLKSELYDALSEADKDKEVKGVIITGGKEVFSGGANIQDMAEADAVEMFYRQGLIRVVRFIETMPKPVIAAISGYALGGGCELALSCDVRVASDTAVLGHPEIKLGIIPGGGGTQRLSRLVGLSRAKDIIFSGKYVKAREAYRIGLVDEVVPADKLLEASENRINSYIRHGSVALGAAKLSVNYGTNTDINSGDILEHLSFALLFSTDEQKERMKAFLNRQKEREGIYES